MQLKICVLFLYNPNQKWLKQIIAWIFGHYSDTRGNGEVFSLISGGLAADTHSSSSHLELGSNRQILNPN